MKSTRSLLALVLLSAGVSLYGADYLTEGVDNGRTGWLKNEKVFNTTNVQTMRLLWKVKPNSTPRQMHNLFAPLDRLRRHDTARREGAGHLRRHFRRAVRVSMSPPARCCGKGNSTVSILPSRRGWAARCVLAGRPRCR